ncbi:MAG: corrinoid protein [Oscillospiraceae bacterium]|nr:corrinoid protein [Oscillospiraceae bacterium]
MPTQFVPPVPRRHAAQTAAVKTASVADAASDELLTAMAEALIRGQKKKVSNLCEKALDAGISPQDILAKGLMSGMSKLGEDFSAGRAFVPEMLMAARCMNAAMELLKPRLVGDQTKAAGRVCLGTVRGDLHDIGKNLVKIMMEGAGLEVIDLGVDVAPETFVRTAIDHDCGLIACSSLLTTSMNEMRAVVRLAEEAGVRGRVKIMVGGAPISESFCREIGADVYTDDAASAARAAVSLLSAG